MLSRRDLICVYLRRQEGLYSAGFKEKPAPPSWSTDPPTPELCIPTSEIGISPGNDLLQQPPPPVGVEQLFSTETPFSPPLVQEQDPMDHHALYTFSNGPASTSSKTTSDLPLQEAPSTSMEAHRTAPVDLSPRPLYPPPMIPDPTGNQNPSPSPTPKATDVQVRTLCGSHTKLTCELAGDFSARKRGSCPGKLRREFGHYRIDDGRITARRSACYGPYKGRIFSYRYIIIESLVPSPAVCADTLTRYIFRIYPACRLLDDDFNLPFQTRSMGTDSSHSSLSLHVFVLALRGHMRYVTSCLQFDTRSTSYTTQEDSSTYTVRIYPLRLTASD